MFACRRGTTAGKSSIQDLHAGYQCRLHPSPVRKFVAARTSHLICEERGYPVANPIIVWFDNALPILVDEPDEACFIKCFPELWIDAWLSRRQHRTYHFVRCLFDAAELELASARIRRTEVRPMSSRRAISALLIPARWSFRISAD